MRWTAAFRRLEQCQLGPELDVERADQRPDAARPLFERRTELAGATPTDVSFGDFRPLRPQFLLLERDKPVPLGSRALELLITLLGRHRKLVNKQDFMARVWSDAFVESLKATTRLRSRVTEVAFPLLVNEHERRSPDGAAQSSTLKSAAT